MIVGRVFSIAFGISFGAGNQPLGFVGVRLGSDVPPVSSTREG